MGNQQLIILIIGVVIVGIATVVAIDAWDQNRTQAAQDALAQDLAKMAADAQAWKQKPQPFGGQGLSCTGTPPVCTAYADANFTGLTDLNQLGYETASGSFTNLNGVYQIVGTPGAAGAVVAGFNDQFDVAVELTVDGLGSGDIASITCIGSTASATGCP